jgi:hypothetical protein
MFTVDDRATADHERPVPNVLHLLLPAGEGGPGLAVDYLAVSPAARASR